MKLLQQILTENDCYKANQKITPKGVMVHSTGANNPNLKRYVQPLEGDANCAKLLDLLGANNNKNDWNRGGLDVCVHGFIGKLADGSVVAVQTLPWNWRGWHAGTGTSGKSANNTHISFEICEDALNDKTYFDKVYREAVELTAMLCKEYNLDPLEDGVVICHSEGYRRGIASGHADVEHWFPKFGKSMNDFRKDVKEQMEDDDMTGKEIYEKMMEYLRSLPTSDYAKESSAKGVASGYFKDGNGDKLVDDPHAPLKRQEFAEVLNRMGLLDK